MTDWDFFYAVGVDVPEVAGDVVVTHRGEELHVLAHLVVVLGFGGTELEVDHHPFLSIVHHAVRASFLHLTVLYGENRTLVEECPTF